jgi:hypothetical protein
MVAIAVAVVPEVSKNVLFYSTQRRHRIDEDSNQSTNT